MMFVILVMKLKKNARGKMKRKFFKAFKAVISLLRGDTNERKLS